MQFFRGSENDPSNDLESDRRFSDRYLGGFSLETQMLMEPAALEFWLSYLDRLTPDLDQPKSLSSSPLTKERVTDRSRIGEKLTRIFSVAMILRTARSMSGCWLFANGSGLFTPSIDAS